MGTGGANWGANRRFSIRVRIDYVIGKMVQLGGLEPPTSGSTIRRSNQLSYNCTHMAWRPTAKPPAKGAQDRPSMVAQKQKQGLREARRETRHFRPTYGLGPVPFFPLG